MSKKGGAEWPWSPWDDPKPARKKQRPSIPGAPVGWEFPVNVKVETYHLRTSRPDPRGDWTYIIQTNPTNERVALDSKGETILFPSEQEAVKRFGSVPLYLYLSGKGTGKRGRLIRIRNEDDVKQFHRGK